MDTGSLIMHLLKPRCEDPNCAGGVLTVSLELVLFVGSAKTTLAETENQKWIDSSSAYVKSIDPNHIVTWGGCGFMNEGYTDQHGWDFQYDGGSGEDAAALLALPNIAFGTVHLYTNDNGYVVSYASC